MKTLLLNNSDLNGGAAIAAYRNHCALRACGLDNTMYVSRKVTDDWTVKTLHTGYRGLLNRLRPIVGQSVPGLFFREHGTIERSFNWVPSSWPALINESDAELVNLQWVNSEMMSLKDISRIRKPLVMTMQDMWLFCGAEHYCEDLRYVSGYAKGFGSPTANGFNVDRWTWQRKQRLLYPMGLHVVAISQWLADCAANSALLQDKPLHVIPNPIDTSVWKPTDKQQARKVFNLPQDRKILTFGAIGGTTNPRKGYALLNDALGKLKGSSALDQLHVVVFGQSEPENRPETAFPTTYVGRLSDPVAMSVLNSASDVFVNPAIQEAFGQTASEAQACGLPVVAFSGTGIADILEHRKTGYLASHASASDLAEGIVWTLQQTGDRVVNNDVMPIGIASRSRSCARFSYDVVGQQYISLYKNILFS